jgi:hypothetical protein
MKSAPLTKENWYSLRNLVLDACYTKKLNTEKIRTEDFPEVIALIEDYIKNGKARSLDKAALLVARLCPGIDIEISESHAWLLLEKS